MHTPLELFSHTSSYLKQAYKIHISRFVYLWKRDISEFLYFYIIATYVDNSK